MGPHDASMRALALACGDAAVPLLLTVRFEDLRQRSPLDVAGDLTGPHVRALARAGERVRLVVTGAGRDMLEETHWGLTQNPRPNLDLLPPDLLGPAITDVASVCARAAAR